MKKSLKISLYILFSFVFISFVLSFFWRLNANEQKEIKKITEESQKYKNLGGDFILNSDKGQVQLSKLTKNKLVILYFAFTRCPDICPISLSTLASALNLLSEKERENIIPVMVSVDPEHDTPEKVSEYVKFFIPNMIGLSGTSAEIKKIAKSYGVYFSKVELPESSYGYTVDHSTRAYIIGANGIETSFSYNLPPEKIAKVIKTFVN